MLPETHSTNHRLSTSPKKVEEINMDDIALDDDKQTTIPLDDPTPSKDPETPKLFSSLLHPVAKSDSQPVMRAPGKDRVHSLANSMIKSESQPNLHATDSFGIRKHALVKSDSQAHILSANSAHRTYTRQPSKADEYPKFAQEIYDPRTQREYMSGHLPGSLHLDPDMVL